MIEKQRHSVAMKNIPVKLKQHWKKVAAITLTAALLGVGMLVYANLQVRACDKLVFAETGEIPHRKYGLLLGTARITRGRINAFFQFRIEAAAKLYKDGKIDRIIVSGDNSRKEYNETDDMAAALIEEGVAPEDILYDYAGFRTLDSVIRAKNLYGAQSLTVISQRFHCRRAIFIAKANGIDAIGFAATDVSRRSSKKTLVREPLACLLAWMDTRIFHRKPYFEK
jgi:SanA protein